MTTEVAKLSDVVAAYKDYGFSYVSTRYYHAHFTGELATSEGHYTCDVYMRVDFSRPPQIYLKDIPETLKPLAPHIGPSGHICYLANSTISLNVFDPVGQMVACLLRASKVLGQILRGEVVTDLTDEFFSFWGGDRYLCYLDVASESASEIACLGQFYFSEDVGAALFLTDDEGRTSYKAATLGFQVKPYNIAVARIKTPAAPMPNIVDWPIRDVESLLNWQRSLDISTFKKVGNKIQKMLRGEKQAGIILIESPHYSYSVLILFDDELIRLLRFDEAKVLAKKPVIPLVGCRIDERYIASRNIPGMITLSGKKIAIVGCGTIGGYLADLLVKAGAGTGGGKLTLVDFETLGAQNLGRHILGFPYIGKKKATSLSHYLVLNNPDASIRALNADARQVNLGDLDMIIDATADEALGMT
jgi:hypothetical protein